MKVLIFLTIAATLVVIANCGPNKKTMEQRFDAWAKRHNKTFANKKAKDEMLSNFKRRQQRVDDHNDRFKKGEVTFEQATWKHSDLSLAEKRAKLTGVAPPKNLRALPDTTVSYPPFPTGPKSVDWNATGLVTPARDQGGCGSCWAFTANSLVEAVIRKKNISNAILGPQQMVDCKPKGTNGCSYGWPSWALQYVQSKGLAAEKDYPYTGSEGVCKQNVTKMTGHISNVTEIPTRGNETWLRDIVASVGPVGIIICVEDSFFDYWRGVYYEPACCTDLQHAVVIVGYGTDPKQGDYWLIKNSWGPWWGENGFGKMARNRNNSCNVAFSGLFAT